MWDEKELLKQMDDYFINTSKEQFIKDLEETNSLQYVEEVKDRRL